MGGFSILEDASAHYGSLTATVLLIIFMILADTCTRDTEHVSHYVGANAFIFMEQCDLYFIS